MTERESFVRAIRATPEDDHLRMVFADWLEERDDPLAAYVRAECAARAARPGSPAWDAALDRMLAACERAGANLGGWEFEAETARVRARIPGWPRVRYPVVPESDLLRFEKRHGITLPAEYRAYLLQVGNGSPGHDSLDLSRDYPGLARPFPHTPEVAAALVRFMISEDESENPLRSPEEEEEELRSEDGCLQIDHFGCGGVALLVVRGVLRGQVWAKGDLYGPWADQPGGPCGFFAYLEGPG